jgi:hypothetical protein
MDTGYISALAALAGSTIGGFTSLAASWLSQNAQTKAQRFQEDLHRRSVEALRGCLAEWRARGPGPRADLCVDHSDARTLVTPDRRGC